MTMHLTSKLYLNLLRFPAFKGKGRIENSMRNLFFAPPKYEVVHGLCMELSPLEWTEITLMRDGIIEPKTTALFGKLLRPSDIYVDVGAHVGFHTLVARHYVGESGRVIAVEPQPYNCQKILSNWRANDFSNIVLYIAAAGERSSVVVLHDQAVHDKSRLSLCLEPVNDEAQQFQVPVISVENLFCEQAIRNVKLLKIDVEGYELEVVNGLRACDRVIENIIFEVLGAPSDLSDKSHLLLDEVKKLGYQLRTVEGKLWDESELLPENNVWASFAK
jgi:FkbM family methyltransferase